MQGIISQGPFHLSFIVIRDKNKPPLNPANGKAKLQ